MSFLAPLFLLGLTALTVPVLIHLTQRERKTVVPFPSLMFLRQIPHQSVKRRRIRDWPLLVTRLLALAVIVMAFARPFVPGSGVVAAGGAAREVIILLDRSYSMDFGGQWARAQAAARDIVRGLGPEDRASVILFADGAQVIVAASPDQSRLMSAVDAAAPGSGATSFGPALKLAGSLLIESTLPRREVVLISDFQRRAWGSADGLRLPAGTVVTPVSVAAAAGTNVALTPLALRRVPFAGQERVEVTAGVVNRGTTSVNDVPLTLEIDGRPAQQRVASVEVGASASVTFEAAVVPDVNTRITVRAGDDGLTIDNAFHAVLSPPQPVGVIIADGGLTARGDGAYLGRALALGDEPRFDIVMRSADRVAREGLGKARLVVLNDAPVSAELAKLLGRFVDEGGGLLVAAGPRASWPDDAALVLPARIGDVVDRSRGPAATLTGLEYGHAVFEPFRAPRTGNFTAARFYSYRQLAPVADAQTLAHFDDGAPALVGGRAGTGRVLVWASTLDLGWNDLAVRPVFLPFVHQASRYLAAIQPRPAWRTVGDVVDLTALPGAPRDRVALTPSGAQIRLPRGPARTLVLEEAGFYELRDQEAQSAPALVVAANVEFSESDRTPVDPADVATAVGGVASLVEPGAGGDANPPRGDVQEQTQRVWWYLLFAGILLLTGESLLTRHLSRRSG